MKKIIKYFKFFFSMPFFLMCLSLDVGPISNWKSLIFPPTDNTTKLSFEVTYEKHITVKSQEYVMSISLKNETYPDNLLIFYSTEILLRGSNKITRVFSLYPNTLSQGENILTLSMVSGSIKDILEVPTYLKTHASFNPAQALNGVYESPKNDIRLVNGSLMLNGDTFLFYNFDFFVEDEYYSYFKLNKFKFRYEGNFTYQDTFLLLKDDYSYFQRFPKYANGPFRQIPLTIKQDQQGLYYFAFKNKLFVEPSTLSMSPLKLLEYQETNHLYFPKERFLEQRSLEMLIVVENCVKNDLTIRYEFTYFSNLNFIGNCHDSKYCIHTSSSETFNDESDFQEISLC